MQITTETRVGIFVMGAIAVFIYMGFSIGVFRFNISNYSRYIIYFNDVSGLSVKADVKIAGVKVGWVESIELIEGDRARADIMINKKYTLYEDAYAVVRQDGLLGVKYLELVSGDPLLPQLRPGQSLSKPSKPPVSIDTLLSQFKHIATNVEEVTLSFKEAIGGAQGREQLREMFQSIREATTKLASFADSIDRSIKRNEDNIDSFLSIGNEVRNLSDRLDRDIFPALQDSFEKISRVFDRDFERIASRFDATAEAIEEASIQARDGLRSIGSIAEKIDDGKGLLGKLINEDETYRDLKTAIGGVKNYFAKIESLQIVVDSHGEAMFRPGENYRWEDNKSYFEVRIHPTEDYFYLLQLVGSQRGNIFRKEIQHRYYDQFGQEYDRNKIALSDGEFLLFAPKIERDVYVRNSLNFGFQFGKIFRDFAFRFGLFEGYGGVGLDIDIPFRTEKFRWVTTFEAFDFRGWNHGGNLRKESDKADNVGKLNRPGYDHRPHLKWINRVFVLDNLYMTFGADDFISRHNANAFFGAGLRFGDDDIKYFLSGLGGLGGSMSPSTVVTVA